MSLYKLAIGRCLNRSLPILLTDQWCGMRAASLRCLSSCRRWSFQFLEWRNSLWNAQGVAKYPSSIPLASIGLLSPECTTTFYKNNLCGNPAIFAKIANGFIADLDGIVVINDRKTARLQLRIQVNKPIHG
jgi:hypothetical protein